MASLVSLFIVVFCIAVIGLNLGMRWHDIVAALGPAATESFTDTVTSMSASTTPEQTKVNAPAPAPFGSIFDGQQKLLDDRARQFTHEYQQRAQDFNRSIGTASATLLPMAATPSLGVVLGHK
jgi:hypothetical protein